MDWISKIKTNENQALKEIYQLCKEDCILWLSKNFNCSDEDALDIFQLSVIILYDNIITGKLTIFSSHIITYLKGIARNKAMELIRSRKNIVSFDTKPEIFQYVIDENSHQDVESQLVHASLALDQLGDPCKSILQLYYYNDLSMDEITNKMGYRNADSTKNQKYKCLKRLQNIYFNHSLKRSGFEE